MGEGRGVMTAEQPHSWSPVDVFAVDADAVAPEISGLLTPGRAHLVSGEPEATKTWFAAVLATEQLRRGESVVWVDFEMGSSLVVARVRALGVTDEDLTGLYLLTPSEPLDGAEVEADVDRLVAGVRPSLVVFDAMTGVLELHGWSSNDDVAIEAAYRMVFDRFRATGAALLILDHVNKNPETRGKWSTGSQRKVGRADVHLGMECVKPFGRGKVGETKIRVHKDRLGTLPRPVAGVVELRSNKQTGSIGWELRLTETPGVDASGEQPAWRPTNLMQKASIFLERADGPQSRRAIESAKLGKSDYVREAIKYLVADGYATEQDGPHGARLVKLLKPFREADLAPTSPLDESDDLAPTSPQPKAHNEAENATSPHLAPASPPTSSADLAPSPLSPTGGRASAGARSNGVDPDEIERVAERCRELEFGDDERAF